MNSTGSPERGAAEVAIPILWRSRECLVALKPCGLPTQAPASLDSLEQRLRVQLAAESGGAEDLYLTLPHRLDRSVSGVILAALTKRAAGLLGQQFETRKVSKHYLAWVGGRVEEAPARWTDFLVKLPGEARAEIVCVGSAADQMPRGAQEAITEVRVLRQQAERTLLELAPITGRMHQLRLQVAHRGHPILGDALYGSTQAWTPGSQAPGSQAPGSQTADNQAGGKAIALHAWKLQFHDPKSGKVVSVEADPCWPAESMPGP